MVSNNKRFIKIERESEVVIINVEYIKLIRFFVKDNKVFVYLDKDREQAIVLSKEEYKDIERMLEF